MKFVRFPVNLGRHNSLLFTVLFALLLIIQQVCINSYINNHVELSQDYQETGQDESNDEDATFTIDYSLIASAFQTNLVHVFYEIMDIELDQEGDGKDFAAVAEIPNRLRNVLFRLIISINAP